MFSALVLRVPIYADAILPSLALIWPLTILLILPIILVEAIYSYRKLDFSFWESVRVIGVANVLSSVAGLPVGYVVSLGLQHALESLRFRDAARLHAEAARLQLFDPQTITAHDTMTLMWLGLYPRWIMLVSAITMLVLCFVVSWWVESKWITRYVSRTRANVGLPCWRVALKANALSYIFLTSTVLFTLLSFWPASLASGM